MQAIILDKKDTPAIAQFLIEHLRAKASVEIIQFIHFGNPFLSTKML